MCNEPGRTATAAVAATPMPLPAAVLAVAESLEMMAFVAPDLADRADVLRPPAEPRWTAIAYATQDGRGGLIEVAAPLALGRTLASNMLAFDADHPECHARAEDVLRELLNVTCGTLLRQALRTADGTAAGTAASRRTVFVGLPGGKPMTDEAWQGMARDPASSALFAEGQPLLVRFSDRIDGSTELPE
jgi:hypothetical protein